MLPVAPPRNDENGSQAGPSVPHSRRNDVLAMFFPHSLTARQVFLGKNILSDDVDCCAGLRERGLLRRSATAWIANRINHSRPHREFLCDMPFS